jgi:hypothetical protein
MRVGGVRPRARYPRGAQVFDELLTFELTFELIATTIWVRSIWVCTWVSQARAQLPQANEQHRTSLVLPCGNALSDGDTTLR